MSTFSTLADLVCPQDGLFPITLFMDMAPGATDVDTMSWQCVNDPTHNGTLTLDFSPPPKGLSSRADGAVTSGGLGLLNTQPATRMW